MIFQRILVPLDFSAHSDAASEVALDLARRFACQVTLLHLDPIPQAAVVAVEPMYLPPDALEKLYRGRLEQAESNLHERQRDLRERARDTSIDTVLGRGPVVEGILRHAAELGADLIVMGSHGLTGAARFLLGSTTEKVARKAPCPVFITRPDEQGEPQAPAFRRLLVALDYSKFAVPLARLARALAIPGGTIEFMHVFTPPYTSAMNLRTTGLPEIVNSALEKARDAEVERLERFVADLDLQGVKAIRYMGMGKPSDGVLDRAEETQPDLILLGEHGHHGISDRILGTVADRVLRHAPMPVVLLPERAVAAWGGDQGR